MNHFDSINDQVPMKMNEWYILTWNMIEKTGKKYVCGKKFLFETI